MKFLIILFVVIFIFGRLFKFLLKYAIIGMAHKHTQNTSYQSNRKEGSIHINNNSGKENKNGGNANQGGEYIDYEIVK